MKVLTIGNGFVANHLPYPVLNQRLIVDSKYISSVLDEYKPDVIVNCIGKTGRPNVDWCELNKEETATANIALPILLAEQCAKRSIYMIQIGSGCIFFGTSPHVEKAVCKQEIIKDYGWQEDDFANPKSYYSKTKYACDLALGNMENVATLRIRMPISEKNNPRNLLNKLKGYSKVIDIPNSVTFMNDLVRCIDWFITNRKFYSGLYHVTNPSPLTAAEIMNEYKKYVPDHQFEIIDELELSKITAAARSNCLLDTSKLSNLGFEMTTSKKALQDCMLNYIKNI
jgi:nucleoside-diphosphate-sugar epimerase